jgi:hypothetical protein
MKQGCRDFNWNELAEDRMNLRDVSMAVMNL